MFESRANYFPLNEELADVEEEDPNPQTGHPVLITVAVFIVIALLFVFWPKDSARAASFKTTPVWFCTKQDNSTPGYVVQRCTGRHLVAKTIKVKLTGYSGYRFKMVAKCGKTRYDSGMQLYHTDKPVIVTLPSKTVKAVDDAPLCNLYLEGSAYQYRGQHHLALFSPLPNQYYKRT